MLFSQQTTFVQQALHWKGEVANNLAAETSKLVERHVGQLAHGLELHVVSGNGRGARKTFKRPANFDRIDVHQLGCLVRFCQILVPQSLETHADVFLEIC